MKFNQFNVIGWLLKRRINYLLTPNRIDRAFGCNLSNNWNPQEMARTLDLRFLQIEALSRIQCVKSQKQSCRALKKLSIGIKLDEIR